MKKTFTTPNFLASLLLIAGIVAVVYLLFIFSNTLWQAGRKEKLFREFQKEISELQEQNKTLAERLAFQKTPQFLDKYAKANLGKVNSGEKVIVLPSQSEATELDFSGLSAEEKEREILKNLPVRLQWWHVFFE